MDRISVSICVSSWISETWVFDIKEFKDRTSLTWILDKEIRLVI
ncbi:hypothetical protein ES703_124366 [subsurface metagenome]